MSITLARKTQFYHQLYAGYRAGLPMEMLLRSALLSATSEAHINSLLADLQKGQPLASILATRKLISAWEASLLTVGESAGRLEVVLQDLEYYFADRCRLFKDIKSKLLSGIILIVFAIVVPSMPQVASGSMSLTAYSGMVVAKLFLLYLCWQLLVVLPFEKASSGAFNPLLLKSMKWIGPDHLLRELFEVSYLNLLTICLESGLDSVQALKLLKNGSSNPTFRRQHQQAISKIQSHGMSLTAVLTTQGILQNQQILSFVSSSEQSGTMHSHLKTFIERKKGDLNAAVNFQIRRLSQFFYLIVVIAIALQII